jgi:hypothetical protein
LAASIACRRQPLPMHDPSFRRAQQQYARIRKSAYDLVRDDALTSGFIEAPLRLTDTDPHALSVWRATWVAPHPSGWGSWDWEPVLRHAWKRPSDFHLAIWSGRSLCGLAVGRVSDRDAAGRRKAVFIQFVESAHDPVHPLRRKIAYLVAAAATSYGRILGAEWLRLMDPMPGVLGRYEKMGFSAVRENGQVLYCERRIEP